MLLKILSVLELNVFIHFFIYPLTYLIPNIFVLIVDVVKLSGAFSIIFVVVPGVVEVSCLVDAFSSPATTVVVGVCCTVLVASVTVEDGSCEPSSVVKYFVVSGVLVVCGLVVVAVVLGSSDADAVRAVVAAASVECVVSSCTGAVLN